MGFGAKCYGPDAISGVNQQTHTGRHYSDSASWMGLHSRFRRLSDACAPGKAKV